MRRFIIFVAGALVLATGAFAAETNTYSYDASGRLVRIVPKALRSVQVSAPLARSKRQRVSRTNTAASARTRSTNPAASAASPS